MLRTEELIYLLFVMGKGKISNSRGGIHAGTSAKYSVDRMNEELDGVKALQIPVILIFGNILLHT